MGTNLLQYVQYLTTEAKDDPRLTVLLVSVVLLCDAAGTSYQVYFNWIFSVSGFTAGSTGAPSAANGIVVSLYSSVVV